MSVDKRGTKPGTAMLGCRLESSKAGLGISSVDFGEVEIGKIRDQF